MADRTRDRPPDDVRRRGFADRAPLERAVAWVDGHASALGAEEVAVSAAVGRVPAAPVAALRAAPSEDRAGEDGYALRAADTAGASAWSPALLRLEDSGRPLAAGAAALVAAGEALPPGADAILGFEAAQGTGASLEVIAPIAEGSGLVRAGAAARAGAPCAGPGRPLRPEGVALLAVAGVERLSVVRRPRVRIALAGPKAGDADGHATMLRALVERDGGLAEVLPAAGGGREAVRAAAAPGADAILVTGRTGTGADDDAPPALAELGELALHGVALRPGGSAALGRAAGSPVVLLPGDPLACLCAYELLAGRLVRRLAGRDPALPHPAREAEVARKIVSQVGSVDVCLARLAGGRVEPLGVWDFGGLATAARADGFVVVPAAIEGHAPGARVTVHLWNAGASG